MKCFSFDMVVDSDTTNYKDHVELVVEKYPPGYLDVAHTQYYDEGLKSFLEVKSDQELMFMFGKHLKRKVMIHMSLSQSGIFMLIANLRTT